MGNTVSFQLACVAGNMTGQYFDTAACSGTANAAVTFDFINSTCAYDTQCTYGQFKYASESTCNATYPVIETATQEWRTNVIGACNPEGDDDLQSSKWVCIAGVLNSNYYDDAACTTFNQSTPLNTDCIDMRYKGSGYYKLDFNAAHDPCPTGAPTIPATDAPVTVAPVTAAPTPEDSAFDIKHKGMFWALIIAAVSSAVAVL